MKKLSILTGMIFLFLSASSFAQKGKFAGLFDRYGNKDGFKTVNINANIELDDTTDMASVMEGIKNVRILSTSVEKVSREKAEELFLDALAAIKKDGYTEMVNVNDEGEKVGFFVQTDKSGKVNECAVAIMEQTETTLIHIAGEIDFSKAMGLAGKVHMHGFNKCKEK